MPSTGAMSSTALSMSGAPAAYTELGPPLRMMPSGAQSRIHWRSRVGGWISEYTRASRTRRAISCVYCAPKSRMRMREVTTRDVPRRRKNSGHSKFTTRRAAAARYVTVQLLTGGTVARETDRRQPYRGERHGDLQGPPCSDHL